MTTLLTSLQSGLCTSAISTDEHLVPYSDDLSRGCGAKETWKFLPPSNDTSLQSRLEHSSGQMSRFSLNHFAFLPLININKQTNKQKDVSSIYMPCSQLLVCDDYIHVSVCEWDWDEEIWGEGPQENTWLSDFYLFCFVSHVLVQACVIFRLGKRIHQITTELIESLSYGAMKC